MKAHQLHVFFYECCCEDPGIYFTGVNIRCFQEIFECEVYEFVEEGS